MPSAGGTLHPNASAVLLHHSLRDPQSDASAPFTLGSEESFENVRPSGQRNTWSVVTDHHPDAKRAGPPVASMFHADLD